MNRPRNGHDFAGWAVLILAITLGLVLLITAVSLLLFDKSLSAEGGRLLTTIGVGLLGAVAAYIGTMSRRKGGDP